jgi:hypothetical protein
MRLRLIRNAAALYLFSVLLFGFNQAELNAEACNSSCNPGTDTCQWFHCWPGCEDQADICFEWCVTQGKWADVEDEDYFWCENELAGDGTYGWCDCNGSEPNPEG